MENRSYLNLINRLASAPEGLTAKQLAEFLDCSERTIKNYIKSINDERAVIVLNNGLYSFEKDVDFSRLKNQYKYASPADCQLYIVRKLLTNVNGLNIDELLDELYISDKTLEKYTLDINKQIKNLNLYVGKKNGFLILKGDEKDKRELLKRNLRINDYSIIEKDLSSYCELVSIDYALFKSIVSSTFDEFDIHVNDYSFLTILSHLVIKFIRAKGGADTEIVSAAQMPINENDIKCASVLIQRLNSVFQTGMSVDESAKLANLLSLKSVAKEVEVSNIVSNLTSEYQQFVLNCIDKIKTLFGISLKDDEFIYFLSLHIVNLVKRSESGIYNENLLFEQVLNSDSFVYEIAVFVSSELEREYSITIPDAEIGFLAFHIGSVIVKKNLLSEEINIAVCMYDFYGFGGLLRNALVAYETPSVHFHFIDKGIIPPSYTFDILITTPFSKEDIVSYANKVLINPMYNKKDLQTIQRKIEEIEEAKNKKKANIFIKQFFNSSFFEKNVYLENEEEYIRYISQKLTEYSIVDDSFLENVLERERYTPTSFDNGIAIPHAIRGQAIFNNAYVILNDKPIKWGNYEVQAIVMIALREDGYTGFRYVLDTLMDKTSTKEGLQKMIECKNYIDFINYIKI